MTADTDNVQTVQCRRRINAARHTCCVLAVSGVLRGGNFCVVLCCKGGPHTHVIYYTHATQRHLLMLNSEYELEVSSRSVMFVLIAGVYYPSPFQGNSANLVVS